MYTASMFSVLCVFNLIVIMHLPFLQWMPRRCKLETEPKPIERNPQLTYRPHPPPPSALRPFASNGDRHSSGQRKGNVVRPVKKTAMVIKDLLFVISETAESCSPAPPLKSKGDSSVNEIRKFPSGKKSDSTVSYQEP